ncbi:hypothetical protein KCP71_08080 [Salmonella enterica subsp. enterica]|nr:hypothetical protein KCP71_08080 [Salmonella enterica subsp. enterica]
MPTAIRQHVCRWRFAYRAYEPSSPHRHKSVIWMANLAIPNKHKNRVCFSRVCCWHGNLTNNRRNKVLNNNTTTHVTTRIWGLSG